MNRLIELASKLSPTQLREVEDFAEFLGSRNRSVDKSPPRYVDVDAIAGMFSGIGGDKSNKELIREAWDEIAAKYD